MTETFASSREKFTTMVWGDPMTEIINVNFTGDSTELKTLARQNKVIVPFSSLTLDHIIKKVNLKHIPHDDPNKYTVDNFSFSMVQAETSNVIFRNNHQSEIPFLDAAITAYAQVPKAFTDMDFTLHTETWNGKNLLRFDNRPHTFGAKLDGSDRTFLVHNTTYSLLGWKEHNKSTMTKDPKHYHAYAMHDNGTTHTLSSENMRKTDTTFEIANVATLPENPIFDAWKDNGNAKLPATTYLESVANFLEGNVNGLRHTSFDHSGFIIDALPIIPKQDTLLSFDIHLTFRPLLFSKEDHSEDNLSIMMISL